MLNVLYRLGYALEFPSDVHISTEGNQLASCKNIKKVIKVTEFCSTFCLHTSGARRWEWEDSKEVCNGGVACSLLKLGSVEKSIIASHTVISEYFNIKE